MNVCAPMELFGKTRHASTLDALEDKFGTEVHVIVNLSIIGMELTAYYV